MVKKAKALRKQTGNDEYYAPLEKADKKVFTTRLNEVVGKPFKMTVQEPMLIAINIYMSVSQPLGHLLTSLTMKVVRIWLYIFTLRGVSYCFC